MTHINFICTPHNNSYKNAERLSFVEASFYFIPTRATPFIVRR